MSNLLELDQLHFAHGDRTILRGVSLHLAAREILVIIGPSGCGKTSLLRMVAGLERPASGTITLAGTVLNNERTHIAPERRSVGMVFQGLALFPHLTVAQNVGFGLHALKRDERQHRISEELRSVDLEGLGDRYPHQLSGGQQQRVAIARSLVMRPQVLLMDEPFSDLDSDTRVLVRAEVLRILRAHGTSAIMVTHDREDAVHMADRVAEMHDGAILGCGKAEDVLQFPDPEKGR